MCPLKGGNLANVSPEIFANSEIYKLVKPTRVTVERNLLFVFSMKPVRVGDHRTRDRTLK